MIIKFEFSNGKRHIDRHEICKLRSTEKCERSNVKVKRTVIHSKPNQSQNAVPYQTLPELDLLQARVPSQKKFQGAENAFSAAWLLGSRDQRI